ncbi:MAG: glycoside hydrolase family 9 protein, partial [Proteobacteria bacterium]|nr:glycoside hydrolase family 9 protein [Pseudomonadota bacterium]
MGAPLKIGPNGPIPRIVIDQFGYPTKATKVAVIRKPEVGYDADASYAPGALFAVVDQATGERVLEGPPVAWDDGAVDQTSGDKAWWFDFSRLTTPGTYVIADVGAKVQSAPFRIDDKVYRDVLKHAVRMFFYQRAGFEKTARTAGADWADGASHLGSNQDPQTHPWTSRGSRGAGGEQPVKDLRGGWFDAGDFNKYTSWTATNIIVLLRAYRENPAAFGDDFGIAESGNGVPDLLDEVQWGLEWLVRMQNADGSLLSVQGLDRASPPSAAKGPSFYGPETTAASLSGAAAFAYAAQIYSARAEPRLKAFGAQLAVRARQAWTWAELHPNVLFYNNDEARQPGSGGLASGQQEMDDRERLFTKVAAAVYLYALTGEGNYREFVERNYAAIIPINGLSQWDGEKQDVLLYYSGLSGISADAQARIPGQFLRAMVSKADQLPMISRDHDPYRAPLRDYTWGSNHSKMWQSRLYALLWKHAENPLLAAKAKEASLGYLHYIHGVNPLGLVYLTNMKSAGATHSASTMYHHWFAPGSRRWSRTGEGNPGPAPGYLVGGPNPSYAKDR